MRAFSLTLAILASLAAEGFAQRTINYRLTVFGTGKVGEKVFVNQPGGAVKVKAIRGYVADPTKASLREERYLDFFEDGRRPEGDEPLEPDFSITVPQNCGKEPLILLFQIEDKVVPKFLDFAQLKMKTGDQLLFNHLPVPVALAYSDANGEKWNKPVIINPGKNKRIPAPREIAVNRRIFARNAKTDKFVIFNRGVFLKPSNGKEIMFCYMQNGETLPTLETILIHDVKEPG